MEIYLYMEKKRFEERLTVEMYIGPIDFEVPVLSLQPIVENAVRHGVTKRDGGGTIRITTEDAGGSWRILVRDDGVGFDQTKPRTKDRSHLGIQNVRSRIEAVSGGTLNIQSTKGQGTVVAITIPKEKHR